MTLDNVCACPSECGTLILSSTRLCNQIDLCSCEERGGTGKTVSLHEPVLPSKQSVVMGTPITTIFVVEFSYTLEEEIVPEHHHIERRSLATMILPVSLHWLVSVQPSSIMME